MSQSRLESGAKFYEDCALGQAVVSVILQVALRHPSHPWLLHDAAGVVVQALRGLKQIGWGLTDEDVDGLYEKLAEAQGLSTSFGSSGFVSDIAKRREAVEEEAKRLQGYFPFVLLDRFMSLLLHAGESAPDHNHGGLCSKGALKADYEAIRRHMCHTDYLSYDEAKECHGQALQNKGGRLEWSSSNGEAEGLDSEASFEPTNWSWADADKRRQLYW